MMECIERIDSITLLGSSSMKIHPGLHTSIMFSPKSRNDFTYLLNQNQCLSTNQHFVCYEINRIDAIRFARHIGGG